MKKNKHNFELNRPYKRAEIQALVGGELQTYLPQKNKTILAGCFNKELNPECPTQIQAGSLKKVKAKAELLISQKNIVFPVFVKEKIRSKNYFYIGMFRCISGTSDKEKISEAEEKSGRFGKLSYLFNLEKVG